MIKKIAVFCGSNTGNLSAYSEDAKKLANVMSDAGITLIYGGAKVGLMGVIANQMLENNSHVIGVMPKSLVDVEIAHEKLSELRVVNSMHERKALIATLADGFIMLPGGPGSLDEFFEMFTWGQLGYHTKPCGILNTDGYYDNLLKFLDHSVLQGFLKQSHRNMIIVNQEPSSLINSFRDYQAPLDKKWINKSTSPEFVSQ